MKFHPHDYQLDAIKWTIKNRHSGLLLPPGLGKTSIILSAFSLLKQQGILSKMLVIAPIRVASIVWPNEVKKWDDFSHLSVGVLHGPHKDTTIKQNHDILTINPEGLPWLEKHLDLLPDDTMLVCDESTLFKSHSSQRFKILKKHLYRFKKRSILTGTPTPNGMLQLWSQIFILDRGERLSQYITHYRNLYFTPAGFGGYEYRLIPGMTPIIYSKIDDIVMHKSQDELSLPEITTNNIEIELPIKAKNMYNEIKKEFISTYDEQTLTVLTAATQSNKLKQIANGCVYNENREVINVHDEKINAIKELVESINTPLLVIYEYLHDLHRLQEAFNAPYIGGGVKQYELERVIQQWNNGELPILLLQPQAGGHGLNLQDGGCCNIVWYSITFDLELYIQANKRVHRQGVKNAVIVHHIVAKGTVDERIINVLEGKESLQNALLQAMLK